MVVEAYEEVWAILESHREALWAGVKVRGWPLPLFGSLYGVVLVLSLAQGGGVGGHQGR